MYGVTGGKSLEYRYLLCCFVDIIMEDDESGPGNRPASLLTG